MIRELQFGSEETVMWLLIALIGWSLVLLLLVIFLWIWIARLRKRYLRSMGDNGLQVEQALLDMREQITALQKANCTQAEQLRQFEQTLAAMKGRIGFYRYNPFGDQGNDLSFTVAIMDAHRNGVVISSLHNRDMSYVYAKPIVKGESTYKLTPEERRAIEQADESTN